MQKILTHIQRYLLYFFIFTLPWQTIWIIREVFYGIEKWQYGTIGIYVSDIVLLTLLLISLFVQKNQILEYVIKNKKIITILLFFSLWSFTSTLWANDKLLAFYLSVKLGLAIDLFILTQIIPINYKKISFIFIISVFIQSIIGLYQFTTQTTFAQKFLGLQYHDIFSGGNAIVQTAGERWLRVYGGTPHPNIFGIILLCSLLLSIWLYSKRRQNWYLKIFILVNISLVTTNILYTFSRTIWLSSILCISAFVIFFFKNKSYSLKQIITPLMLIASTTMLIVSLYPSLFFDRIYQDTTPTHNSISDRITYASQSTALIKTHPILGTGIGNYTNTFKNNSHTLYPVWQYQPVHNIYLLITSELGIIGFGLFIYILIYIFHVIYKNKKNINSTKFTFIILFTSLLFISLFDHLIWTSHFGLFAFFLFGSLSIRFTKLHCSKSAT